MKKPRGCRYFAYRCAGTRGETLPSGIKTVAHPAEASALSAPSTNASVRGELGDSATSRSGAYCVLLDFRAAAAPADTNCHCALSEKHSVPSSVSEAVAAEVSELDQLACGYSTRGEFKHLPEEGGQP